MADNVTVTNKTDGTTSTVPDTTTFRLDDVGGVLYQVVKVDLGGDGVSQVPDTNSGNKSAGTLRVVLATDQPALSNKLLVTPDLPSGASTAAKQPALGTAGTPSADVISVQGVASGTAIPVSIASVPSHAVTNAGTFAVQSDITKANGTTLDTNSGNKSAGTIRVVLATDQPALTTAQPVYGNLPTGSNGWSVATGSIGATKTDIGTANTAGQVGGWYFYNPNASVAYVQFFNAQASAVTLGSTAPVYSLGIPASSAANVACGMVGLAHATAISIAVTTTRAGSTGPSSTVDYNIFYKQ